MFPEPGAPDRLNLFALVSYIPEPLAGFLDRLRQELVPNCFLRAHVTILPPRPACAPPEVAWEHLRRMARQFHPFEVEMRSIEVFPVTDVIYISIGKGEKQLREMYSTLNTEGLAFQERYPFHPHITLAQELKPDELDELVAVARQRWADFAADRTFRVDKLTFVQSTRRKTWVDLAEFPLTPEIAPGPSSFPAEDGHRLHR